MNLPFNLPFDASLSKALFVLALLLEVSAWLLAGGRPALGSRRAGNDKPQGSLLLRRILLAAGILLMCAYALYCADYLLLAGQLVLTPLLFYRISV